MKVWSCFIQFTEPCFYYYGDECMKENCYICHTVHIANLFQHCITSALCSLCSFHNAA